METRFEKLAKEALELSPDEREAFGQLLLASIDEGADVAEEWAAEAERRVVELDNGNAEAVPMDEALAQLRALLK